jgi:hypothetical protein
MNNVHTWVFRHKQIVLPLRRVGHHAIKARALPCSKDLHVGTDIAAGESSKSRCCIILESKHALTRQPENQQLARKFSPHLKSECSRRTAAARRGKDQPTRPKRDALTASNARTTERGIAGEL